LRDAALALAADHSGALLPNQRRIIPGLALAQSRG